MDNMFLGLYVFGYLMTTAIVIVLVIVVPYGLYCGIKHLILNRKFDRELLNIRKKAYMELIKAKQIFTIK